MTFQFGVEEEFFCLDDSYDLIQDTDHSFFKEIETTFGDRTNSEIFTSLREVKTVPHSDFQEFEDDLRQKREQLAKLSRSYGVPILMTGTHPIADWKNLRFPPDLPNGDLNYRINDRRYTINGLHIHLAQSENINVFEAARFIRYFEPFCVALSVSSPFWASHDTGLQSYRQTVLQGLPHTRRAPTFKTASAWDAMKTIINLGEGHETYRRVRWTCHPHFRLGTIEIRSMDACPEIRRTLAISAFLVALYKTYCANPEQFDFPRLPHGIDSDQFDASDIEALDVSISEENMWRVQKDGQNAVLLNNLPAKSLAGTDLISITEIADFMTDLLGQAAKELHCYDYIQIIKNLTRIESSADRQRSVAKKVAGGALFVRDNSSLKDAIAGEVNAFSAA